MGLSNLSGWKNHEEAVIGTACGTADKPDETPTACGAADKPDETPTVCGAADKPEKAPSACGSACGAGDK